MAAVAHPRPNPEHKAIFEPQSPASATPPLDMEMDLERNAVHLPSPTRAEEPDPRQSLQHVLAAAEPPAKTQPLQDLPSTPVKNPTVWIQEGIKENTEDEGSVQNDSYTRAAEVNPSYTMTVAHTRRNANGTIGSVYSGNKIRHLKKEDGIPLWRKDIQFSFLRAVFEDQTAVFTKASDGTKGHDFADIYIDAMAKSNKTSKVLKDKLLSDHQAAVNMAMICLLVNVGRMNTTLNFFPEMRAQLRTYHSIPSLQAHQDPNAYKQLQDAPRLKSILKGASEDPSQPNTVEKIKAAPIPRTNPVNLIFVLSQYAPKISETHFFPPRDFFDLVMRGTLSSRSRAKAFLWLIWFYLESDFSREAAENNPFGQGQHGDSTGGLPLKVPAFEHLTEDQANAENVDTEEEKTYGEMKREERKRILEEDETAGPPMKRGKKNPNAPNAEEGGSGSPQRALSDTDRTRSPSPMGAGLSHHIGSGFGGAEMVLNGLNDGAPSVLRRNLARAPRNRVDQSNPQRLVLKTRMDHVPDSSSPAPPGSGHPILQASNTNGLSQRRPRPETSHQKAVNINRKMRIDHILHKKLGSEHSKMRKRKRKESSSAGFTAMKRIQELPDDYNTEDEHAWGPGGLMPNPGEDEDYGEEALRQKKAVDRAVRRLAREDNGLPLNGLIKGYQKRKRKAEGYTGDEGPLERATAKRSRSNGSHGMRPERSHDGDSHEEALDDLDLDLLGESRDDDHLEDEMDYDSGIDESEGEGDDMSEEEMMD